MNIIVALPTDGHDERETSWMVAAAAGWTHADLHEWTNAMDSNRMEWLALHA